MRLAVLDRIYCLKGSTLLSRFGNFQRHSPWQRSSSRNQAHLHGCSVRCARGRGREPMAKQRSLIWFRKGLRLHDNPALLRACDGATNVLPVFVLDPYFLAPDPNAPSPGSSYAGVNRIKFLLESLSDLHQSLQSKGSRLLLVHGDPAHVIPDLLEKWQINTLCFEYDVEPYALERDSKIKEAGSKNGVEVFSPASHTLFDPQETIKKNGGSPPSTFGAFCKAIGKPSKPVGDAPQKLPEVPEDLSGIDVVSVPSLEDLGYKDLNEEFSPFPGGETEGLKRLEEQLSDKKWVAEFQKPKGNPAAFIKPATTCLSPYMKFGCVSARLFHSRLLEIYKEAKSHTQPPMSLEGQLFWREFFYTQGLGTPKFDQMAENPVCKQIGWHTDEKLLGLWRDAQTGFPWIDAAMTQLRKWGWMHHLARHAVACFLTRGDLFLHWEKGRDVFERLLIDSDWCINNGNWMWLSASAFFYQYHRIYSPISFAQKHDPEGKYIKHFLPVLKDMPKAYIYEPWKAPMNVQQKANCIIGKDYPKPVIDHGVANKECRERMAAAYNLNKETNGHPSEEDIHAVQAELDAKYGTDDEDGDEAGEKPEPSPKKKSEPSPKKKSEAFSPTKPRGRRKAVTSDDSSDGNKKQRKVTDHYTRSTRSSGQES